MGRCDVHCAWTKHLRVCCVAVCVVLLLGKIHAAQEPIWARAAVPLAECSDQATAAPQRISSPDGKTTVDVDCRDSAAGDRWTLRAIRSGQKPEAISLAIPRFDLWRPQEVLWSPDSRWFVVNGSENAYSGFAVALYELRDEQVELHNITRSAQLDMLASFPPCKAAALTEETCRRIETQPGYNMSALAWTKNAASLILFAEVPCTSSYGGIMCQVQGYEIEVPSGRILKRMSAKEVKRLWQSSAAWNIRIPEAPEYKRSSKR
jgi:hypothetical protein